MAELLLTVIQNVLTVCGRQSELTVLATFLAYNVVHAQQRPALSCLLIKLLFAIACKSTPGAFMNPEVALMPEGSTRTGAPSQAYLESFGFRCWMKGDALPQRQPPPLPAHIWSLYLVSVRLLKKKNTNPIQGRNFPMNFGFLQQTRQKGKTDKGKRNLDFCSRKQQEMLRLERQLCCPWLILE